MTLRLNILVNYASQIYVTLISIVMVPMYVHYMGAEAFGLVGFFAMLQAWFQLLDMGLTPTLSRETARFKGGATDALTLRRLLRGMEGVFVCIAIVGGFGIMFGADFIAAHWLRVQQLSLIEVKHSIILIAAIVALRWICGLYRGAINGFERFVWLSGFNIIMATGRSVFVIPVFIYIGANPTIFFGYQLLLALIELLVFVIYTYYLLPNLPDIKRTPWEFEALRKVIKFSLSIAFTGSVWVLVTQTDKLLLSRFLSLTDYAYFTIAVLVAGGVNVITGPISNVLLPRMSKLTAEEDDQSLIHLYHTATQAVAAIAAPAAFALFFFAEKILWAWTGDAEIAIRAAPVLMLYSLGNGILALAAFPYYLQYAKGDLRLHLIGNGLFAALLIPGLCWATSEYGMIGAGWAWLLSNVCYFVFWVPKVHQRFFKGLNKVWMLNDIFGIVLPILLFFILAKAFVTLPNGRAWLAASITSIALVSGCLGASVGSKYFRALASKNFLILNRKINVRFL